MVTVILATNALDLSSYEKFDDVTDVESLLRDKFDTWPETARIYHNEVAVENDVTPVDEETVKRLLELDGIIWVVVYPADPVTAIIAAIAVAALAVVAFMLLIPKIPKAGDAPSPNNGLSNRVNSARPTKRIPDIYGTVLSVPDLIAVPYKKFVNNLEVEIAYMCIGRGQYDIQAVYDGDTPIAQIAGSAALFYGPYTSPNYGTPQAQIGTAIGEPVLNVIKSNEVNGQVLRPPNANRVTGDDNIRFVYPDTIERTGSDIDFSEFFESDDELTVANADFGGDSGTITVTQSSRFNKAGEIEFEYYNPTAVFTAGQSISITNGGFAGDDGVGGILYVDLSGNYVISSVTSTKIILNNPQLINTDWNTLDSYPSDRTDYKSSNFSIPTTTAGLNLNGTYTVLSVTSSQIVLSNPSIINSAWDNIEDLDGGATDYASSILSTSGDRWVGYFIADLPTLDRVLFNFIAETGLYTISDKGREHPLQVTVSAELTPINDSDLPSGPSETFTATMGLYDVIGDDPDNHPAGTKDPIRYSLFAEPTFTGRCRVRVRRTSPTPDYDGQVIDDLKWRDMYAMAPVDVTDFGNVTTVHTRTYGTSGASSVKERKLNCTVARKVPQRNLDNTFGPTMIASNSAADIICAMALDPYVGNRPLSEIDVPQIYDTIDEIKEYFGFDMAADFCYTFDDDNMSFEEMVQSVANAVYCGAYRQGSQIRLKFERETDDSVLLFNHRNKMPASETRTITFGGVNDYDGIEYEYIDPEDSSTQTIYIPTDRSALNPKKVQSVGQRNVMQAHIGAWRAYNKIRYQHTATEFDALQEADLLLVNDRVLASNGTRGDSIEGEVDAQSGLELTLSQPFEMLPGRVYTIFLQHTVGIVEAIEIAAPGSDPHKVILAEAPSYALSTAVENYAKATYKIAADTDVQTDVFLVSEKTPGDSLTSKLQLINYDSRYYQNDKDYA